MALIINLGMKEYDPSSKDLLINLGMKEYDPSSKDLPILMAMHISAFPSEADITSSL